WDSRHIGRDEEAHAVVVAPVDKAIVSHWSVWNGGDVESEGYVELAPGIARSGYAGASINQMERGVISQRIEVSSNVEAGPFEFSVYFYTASEGDETVRLEANFRDDNYDSLAFIKSEIVPTADSAGEWKKLTLRGEVPATVKGQKVATIQAAIHVQDG